MPTKNETGRSSKLLKDIGIYSIGNLGSRLITFLLVPIYTFYISVQDYGYLDISWTIVFLLSPFITLQLRDGTFRFLLNCDDEVVKKQVITSVCKILLGSTLIVSVSSLVLSFFWSTPYFWYIIALGFSISFYEVFIQVARGLGFVKQFVVAGIISALLVTLMSIVLVVFFNMGLIGIFIANIAARIVSMMYIEVRLQIISKYFSLSLNDNKLAKKILQYSIPLIPTTLCWWITGNSDRFYIEYFCGLRDNGIYAVATKFTAILQILSFIFYQAWQETAIIQYQSVDKDKFFSNIFNIYIYGLTFIIVIYSFVLKLNYSWLVEDSYKESIIYIYPLAIVALLLALVQFLDMGYQCAKKTVSTLPSIIGVSILNILLNFLFIPILGIYGSVITAFISFLALLIYRLYDTRKFFRLRIDIRLLFPMSLMLISGVVFYLVDNTLLLIVYILIFTIAYTFIIPKYIRNEIKKKIMQKKNLEYNNT